MKTCQKCGTKAENDDIYCPECGVKLKAVSGTKKITLWTILKVIGMIIFFIIFINIFKNQPIIALVVLALFFIWTGLLNSILKKLFNAELSTGVKIVITVILVIMLFTAATFTRTQLSATKIQPEFRQVSDEDIDNFVEKMNKIIDSKSNWELQDMLNKGTISHEVFKDLQNTINNKDNKEVVLELTEKRIHEWTAELVIRVKTMSVYEQKVQKTEWIFERGVNFENTQDSRWVLVKIAPRLSDIISSRSFEEEVGYKLDDVNRPVIQVSDTALGASYTQKNPNS